MKSLTLLYGNIESPEGHKSDDVLHLTSGTSKHSHALKKSSVDLLSDLEDAFSSALIYIEKESDVSRVEKILKKIKKDKTRTLIILDASNSHLIQKIPKYFLKLSHVSLLVRGEIFGQFSESDVSKIFHKAIGTNEFELTFGENHPVALISEKDHNTSLKSLLEDGSEKIVLLFYDKPQSLQTVGVEMAKEFPEMELVYTKAPKIRKIDHKKLIQELTVHFESKPLYISDVLGFRDEIKKITSPKQHHTKKESASRVRTFHIKAPVKFAAICIGLFLFVSLFTSFLGMHQLLSAKRSLEASDLISSKSSLTSAQTLLSFSSPAVSIFTKVIPLDSALKELLFSSDTTITLAINTLSKIDSALKYQNLHNGQQAIAQLTHAYFTFSRLGQADGSPNVLGESASKIASILQGFPDISGENEEKTYLLLFQNNAELRPTGGFIGSIGELSVKDGKIQDLNIRDVYQIDGQLEEHIEPHFIVRKYLQPHLYLRDSNFDIEFDTSAQKAAQLYFLVTGKRVDGVIAINFEVIKRLLKESGTIELPEHNLVLDHVKAQELIQNSIQDDFFPGSTKKKDVLQSLLTKILLKLETDPQLASSFARSLPDLLDQKHILFSFSDKNIERLYAANGYTGSINDTRKGGSSIRNDIFGLSEANIGVNKANNSLQRRVEYQVYIGEESMISKATLKIFNTGNDAQTYKVYLRFIVPKSSTLQSISLNGQQQEITPAITDPQIFESQNHLAPSGLQVDEKEEDEYKTIGFVAQVEKNTSGDIVVVYTNGLPSPTIPMKYSLMYIKQPGTTEYPLNVNIDFNNTLDTFSTDFSTKNGSAYLTEIVQQDKIYELDIKK